MYEIIGIKNTEITITNIEFNEIVKELIDNRDKDFNKV